MSVSVIKEFLVSLGFNVDEAGLSAFGRGVADASLKVAALGAAVTAAAGAVFWATAKIADELDTVADLADRIGSSAAEVDKLTYAAQLNGSSVEAARASLDNFNRTIGQAANGMGRGVKWFEQLGISLKDSNGEIKSTTALLLEVGDKIKGLGGAEQAGILEGLGIDKTMLATMTGGYAAMAAEVDEMYAAFGLNYDDAAAKAGDFNDSLDRLMFTAGAATKAVGARFLAPFAEGMNRLRKMMLENGPRIVAAIGPILDMIVRIALAFLALASRVAQAVGIVLGWIAVVQEATDGWAGVIGAVALAWKYLNLSFLASPIGIVLALGAAIAALADDFLTWQEGGDSLIDWSAWAPGIDAAIGAVTILRDILGGFFTMMFASVDMLVSLLTGDFAGAWRAAGEYVEAFLGIGRKAWELLQGIGGALGLGDGKLPSVGMDKPALTPNASDAATVTGGATSQQVNQQTQIILQGSAATDTNARAVSGAQRGVNADLARNMKGAAR